MQLYPNQGRIQEGCLAQEELFEIAQEALNVKLMIEIKSLANSSTFFTI